MADFHTELNRHIAAIEACIGQSPGDTTPDPIDGPSTATPRDPDGLMAENAMARTREWFQC